uniref:Putative secreted protein n=1 Tax=Panstrongylus lignarius TaxID=156445 RepID=A0A224Y4P8_9HEMI
MFVFKMYLIHTFSCLPVAYSCEQKKASGILYHPNFVNLLLWGCEDPPKKATDSHYVVSCRLAYDLSGGFCGNRHIKES